MSTDDTNVKIAVIGSINFDITTYVTAFPKGEDAPEVTDQKTSIGGKGLNQAVAAARMGASVSMIGCVGDDDFGQSAIEHLRKNGVNCDYVVMSDNEPTGLATIMVDSSGENMIRVAAGANMALTEDHVKTARSAIENADIVLVQAEIPPETVGAALDMASGAGVKTVFNPAPASKGIQGLLGKAAYITPNEAETEMLSGIYPQGDGNAAQALLRFSEHGAEKVVITCGSRGCIVSHDEGAQLLPTIKVKSVDSTGAGDVFNGVFAVGLANGLSMKDAAKRAGAAAAMSVTKPTVDSAPTLKQLESFLKKHAKKPD